jgi:hypothetical protein
MRAILVLAKKYADKVASGADVAASTINDVAEQASGSISNNRSSSSKHPPDAYPPTFNLDSHSAALLQDMKEMLERLGKNHSLDGLLAALRKVVCDPSKAPVILVDQIKKVEGETETAAVDQVQPVTGTLREYFARIGEYLDKGLDDPGWVMSKEGAKVLESLFDDGVELIGIVGDSVAEVGEDVISPEADHTSRTDESIRVQFRKDFRLFMEEAGAYVSAVKNDRTTMQIFRTLDTLGDDLSGLLQKRRYGLDGLGGWTHWVGWAIPKLMRILPRGAIPIPSVEIKTKNLEGGLYALFVQGLGGGREEGETSFRLIPDQVVLKEWTEVRIDMAERERPLAGPASKPGVQTTSRVHIHLDGVRAKVESMSYYFKYLGGLFGYEDEGLLSVDVGGMNSLHSGLGADIEVEIENRSVEFDSGNIPEIVIEHEELIEHSGNRDIQEAVSNSGSGVGLEREIITDVDSLPEPLFNVVDVKIALSGLKFKIDKSRHWILNKLLQPFSGPVIARVVRQALEDKVRLGLHNLALSLGAVVKDAKEKGEIRRAKERSRLVQDDPASRRGLVEEDMVEGPREFLSDWWSAILQKGPMVLGYDIQNEDEVRDGQVKVVETNTTTEATTKGIILSSTTKTTEQPKGTPVMVYNKASQSMEIIDHDIEEGASSSHSSEEGTVVAIGGGAQLFPDKGGNHDHEDQQQRLLEGVRDGAKKAVNEVVEGLDETEEAFERIEDRWEGRKQAEERSSETWKSDAFEFE